MPGQSGLFAHSVAPISNTEPPPSARGSNTTLSSSGMSSNVSMNAADDDAAKSAAGDAVADADSRCLPVA